jgi:hypothetical protein
MKHYSTHAIDQLTKYALKDTAAFNWLINNGYRELVATFDAIRDDKKSFKYLMDNSKHVDPENVRPSLTYVYPNLKPAKEEGF